MAKKIDVQKEPVKLREKVLKNGSISLFLDIWKSYSFFSFDGIFQSKKYDLNVVFRP